MKPSFATSRQSLFLLFTFLLVASIFIVFYLRQVSDKEDQLIQRDFKQLNTISTTIQNTVDAITTAVKNSVEKNKNISPDSLHKVLKPLITKADSIKIEKVSGDNNSSSKLNKIDPLFIQIKSNASYMIFIRLNTLNELIEKKKAEDLFDDIFIATKDGEVILSSTSMSISKIQNVISDKKDTINFPSISSNDTFTKYILGGEENFIFIHPTKVFTSITPKEGKQWIICGLIKTDKFLSESKAISANIIIAFFTIILLIILSWPLLKLRFVSKYGHIRTADIMLAILSILFAAAIITFAIMDIFVTIQRNANLKIELNSLASTMNQNFLTEIQNAEDELVNISDSLKADGPKTIKGDDKKDLVLNSGYPYFELIAWIDTTGMQQKKFFLKKRETPFIPVANRPYFNYIINRRVWNEVNMPDSIFIQPQLSFTTGDYTTTVSKYVYLNKKVNKDSVKRVKYVGAIDFLPYSIYAPILPNGFTYCIIDKKGEVLLHSNPDLNLMENFFQDCENANIIQAAVSNRTKEYFNTVYWGKEIKGIVYPIKDISWYIIVMSNNRVQTGDNVIIIVLSSFQFMLYLIPFFVFLLAFMIIKPAKRNSIWPQEDKMYSYFSLLVLYLIFSVVLIVHYYFTYNLNNIFIVTWLYPHSAIVLSIVFLQTKLSKQKYLTEKYLWGLITIVLAIDIIIIFLILNENDFPLKSFTFIFITWIVVTFLAIYLALNIDAVFKCNSST